MDIRSHLLKLQTLARARHGAHPNADSWPVVIARLERHTDRLHGMLADGVTDPELFRPTLMSIGAYALLNVLDHSTLDLAELDGALRDRVQDPATQLQSVHAACFLLRRLLRKAEEAIADGDPATSAVIDVMAVGIQAERLMSRGTAAAG
jgi:hypothetical protein